MFSQNDAVLAEQVLAAKTAIRLEGLSEQFPTVSRTDLTKIFPLFARDTLDVVVSWSCAALGIRGFHYLADLPVGMRSDAARALLVKASETSSRGRYEESEHARTALLDSVANSELSANDCPLVYRQSVARQPNKRYVPRMRSEWLY